AVIAVGVGRARHGPGVHLAHVRRSGVRHLAVEVEAELLPLPAVAVAERELADGEHRALRAGVQGGVDVAAAAAGATAGGGGGARRAGRGGSPPLAAAAAGAGCAEVTTTAYGHGGHEGEGEIESVTSKHGVLLSRGDARFRTQARW